MWHKRNNAMTFKAIYTRQKILLLGFLSKCNFRCYSNQIPINQSINQLIMSGRQGGKLKRKYH